jgi:hypothetical protein
MEVFKPVWDKKTDQAIWMDAIKVGDVYYHATCYDDMSRPNAQVLAVGGRRLRAGTGGTPDPVLGKRKFDEPMVGEQGRMRTPDGRILRRG